MNLIKDYKDASIVKKLISLANQIELDRVYNVMEICGGHTHSLVKYGLINAVKNINFIHGPGCPVCVMPKQRLDEAVFLASMPNTIFCTLADLIKVPASNTSLEKLRANGCDIKALYSPLEVLKIASENKDKNIIFFAIGFETTAPMSAVLLEKIIQNNIKNVFFHINHVKVPEPVCALLDDKECNIDGFLAPSHVSVIIGKNAYLPLAKKYKKPFTISGFEPVDLMHSIINLCLQFKDKSYEVYNEYSRIVQDEGNIQALNLINKYFKSCDFLFRGVGVIKDGGMDLKDEYAKYDAKKVFDIKVQTKAENKLCKCPSILKGIAKPSDCEIFAKACTPAHPVGSCMVSSEGACAAYYKYIKA
ncbi:hydrogenase formation protein HypD [Campylobacter canadensis]|uniref:Hydrogenase formation protein HypD n=1 Tax=Campylobacter canadensis TaxID=449520 RepID=A0ABS7WQR7_9BACT|nr:hydrogenase formation protein HypD [Campylobacter canadensis]MBZ7986863.1 hydrogenase formation protein HypD [Campylobacter canadensis]MBZ7994184.1 hydrogenase formation protein HypD [Campylobacter canadensis]MBZ7995823.1 hydrogenase formation protein HypD [Campylobacter canadensis]MBZ7997900.1 hydrogenase formation protein HypD [Campylobacter canadensis]MBZ7999516.1 hydrogenase formation protein HypD [Campylobacter canadensis]